MSQQDREQVENNLPVTAKLGVYLTKEYGTLAIVFFMLAFLCFVVYTQNERMYEISVRYATKNAEIEKTLSVLVESGKITNDLLRDIKLGQK